jgi:uncharacterized protein
MTQGGRPSVRWREKVAEALLAAYKGAISPVLHAVAGAGGGCRFQPTCSEYAAIAVAEHGAVRGGALAVRRLLRCHPLHRGGFDPVPASAGYGAQGTGRSESSDSRQWTASQSSGHR